MRGKLAENYMNDLMKKISNQNTKKLSPEARYFMTYIVYKCCISESNKKNKFSLTIWHFIATFTGNHLFNGL